MCELYVQPEQLPSSLLQFHNKAHPQFTGRIQSGVQLTEDFICKHCTETEYVPEFITEEEEIRRGYWRTCWLLLKKSGFIFIQL